LKRKRKSDGSGRVKNARGSGRQREGARTELKVTYTTDNIKVRVKKKGDGGSWFSRNQICTRSTPGPGTRKVCGQAHYIDHNTNEKSKKYISIEVRQKGDVTTEKKLGNKHNKIPAPSTEGKCRVEGTPWGEPLH